MSNGRVSLMKLATAKGYRDTPEYTAEEQLVIAAMDEVELPTATEIAKRLTQMARSLDEAAPQIGDHVVVYHLMQMGYSQKRVAVWEKRAVVQG